MTSRTADPHRETHRMPGHAGQNRSAETARPDAEWSRLPLRFSRRKAAAGSTFSRMDSDLFADAQRYVGQLLGYLEELHAALDLSFTNGGAMLPDPLPSIFRGSGHLQGLYLQTQGFLSADLQEFIRGLAYSFELEVRFPGAFKLPFVGDEVLLQRKTLNPFHEAAWELYHAGLLSAYALRPLAFARPAGSDPAGIDVELRVTEAAAHPETQTLAPQLAQRLSGLNLLAEEILREKDLSAAVREKIRVLRAAVEAAVGML